MKSSGYVVAGKYHIERHIGSGGMGELSLAHDTLGRREAIKLLPPEVEADPSRSRRTAQGHGEPGLAGAGR